MKALLLKGPRQLEMTDLPRPELGPQQIRIRVRNVGVCGSDYSSVAGKLPFTRFPIVPGHEASGEIIEAAAGSRWKSGDPVLIHPILCLREDPAFTKGEVHHSDSTEVLGVVSRNGAYAEEVVVEDYMVRAMTAGMDFESAAMVEPVAVAVRAVKEGAVGTGSRVLVLGAGNIGLLAVQVARAYGASRVAVTDVVPSRLELARRLGFDEAIDVRDGFPSTQLERQFDAVIDGVGLESTVRDALTACGRGGRIVVYGVPAGDISFPLKVAFSKDVRLITSRLYDADFEPAVDLIANGRMQLKELITHRLTLDQTPAFLGRVLDGQEAPVKVMIAP